MRKLIRGPEPALLAENWEAWGIEWETRRNASSGVAFNWRQHQNQPVNQILVPFLKAQTQDHCSFCDQFPVSPPSIDTIEHFRPKSRFPREAYRWQNLYYCCMYCQGKGSDWSESALHPDAEDYEFDRYFRWDHTLGTLEVNELASPADQERARATIDLYSLNRLHPSLRKRELFRRSRLQDQPLDEFAYRDYLAYEPAAS